jgi:RNA polymerase sigma-70 factor, ECF subfamily
MADSSSFDDIMARLRGGDDDAARQVFQRFGCRLITLARQRLDRRMRPKMDAEDVLQSAFCSFFKRAAQGQYDLASWEALWGLLVVITISKCAGRAEHFRAAKRDVARESAAPASGAGPLAREPTPEEAAVLTETVEELLRGLEPHEEEMLMLFLQGHSIAEISSQVGWAERTVHRLLARTRKRLERMQERSRASGS